VQAGCRVPALALGVQQVAQEVSLAHSAVCRERAAVAACGLRAVMGPQVFSRLGVPQASAHPGVLRLPEDWRGAC